MTVQLLPDAESDMRAAAQWYESRRDGLGERFLSAVVTGLLDVEANPD